MNSSTNYKCPACTAPLKFSATLNKLVCEYCESKYEIAEIDKLYGKKVEDSAQKEKTFSKAQGDTWDGMQMHAYHCESCGAEIICEKNTVATSCPYCGNTTVIPQQFTAGRIPDYVIPFKVEKQAAIEGLKQHYKGRKLLPKVFSAQNHIEEVKGIYVPFWLFDGKADVALEYDGTTTREYKSGDYMVTQTSHYDVRRSGIVDFEKISVDASEKMDDAMMDSIEPFDYSELKPFSASYLPGFLAEAYDVSEQDCEVRMKKRAENSAEATIKNQISGYTSLIEKSKSIVLNKTNTSYAFMPVWLLSTKWNDKNFLFAMNGQTGKMVGELPVDKKRFWGYFFMITAIATAVLTPILYLIL